MECKLLDTKQAANYLGVQKGTLDAWRYRGDGPRFLKLGRLVKYRAADLDEWLESRLCDNTSSCA